MYVTLKEPWQCCSLFGECGGRIFRSFCGDCGEWACDSVVCISEHTPQEMPHLTISLRVSLCVSFYRSRVCCIRFQHYLSVSLWLWQRIHDLRNIAVRRRRLELRAMSVLLSVNWLPHREIHRKVHFPIQEILYSGFNISEEAPNQSLNRPNDCVYFPLGANAASSLHI